MHLTANQSPIARNKLLLLACFVGIGSIVLLGWVAVDRSTSALLTQGKESLLSVRQARASQVEDYFRTIRGQVKELARSRMIGQAAIAFSSAFDEQNEFPSLPVGEASPVHSSLSQYYHQDFFRRLQAHPLSAQEPLSAQNIDDLMPAEPASRILQWMYLSNNPNPVGEKDALVRAEVDCEYNRVHAIYHPILRSYLKTFDYYDIFLFDLRGNVVYSVFKETDFATNFRDGPYRDTNLGDVYRRACDASNIDESHLHDFSSYLPSYGDPASFIACPVFYEGNKVGVVAFQMPLKRIDDILQQSVGLGLTGESFLVGDDGLMRTDSRLSSASTLLKIRVNTEPVRRAIQGETGDCLSTNYRGKTVQSSFSPITIEELHWVAVAEMELAEILIPAHRLRNTLLASGLTIGLLAILVSLVSARFLSNERRERDLLRSACLDKLTGLPNRFLFLNRLEDAFTRFGKNPGRYMALLFLDFDRFKAINDEFGHAVGDMLLQEIAHRLRASLNLGVHLGEKPESISAARLGGDEFVVLLDLEGNEYSAEETASILLRAFSVPYQLAGHEVCSNASIGIALCDPTYLRGEDLLRDADAAMYEAKKLGKARYVVFDHVMQNRLQEKLSLENDLKMALVKQQFVIQYQPVFNLLDGRVHSVDTVLAWHHPQRGIIPADGFMKVAEEIDLATPINEWLLQKACEAQFELMQSFGDLAPKYINVPLNRRGCLSNEILGYVEGALCRSGLSPDNLQLEFCEDFVVSDLESATRTLQALRSLGVLNSMDNFCSSHSALVTGKAIAIDSVKIENALISCVEKSQPIAAFVHSLALLAHNLKLSTIADGIDSAEQLLAVRAIGCHFGKGAYLGEAMPLQAFDAFLRDCKMESSTVFGAMAFLSSMHQGIGVVPIHPTRSLG